jgi:hypothetical protein
VADDLSSQVLVLNLPVVAEDGLGRWVADAGGAVSVAMAAEGRRSNANATRQWLHRNRRVGRIITVDHEGEVVIPTFQLDEAFDVDPLAGDVIEALGATGMSPWAIWHWFYAANGWLGDRPIDVLQRRDRGALLRVVVRLTETA